MFNKIITGAVLIAALAASSVQSANAVALSTLAGGGSLSITDSSGCVLVFDQFKVLVTSAQGYATFMPANVDINTILVGGNGGISIGANFDASLPGVLNDVRTFANPDLNFSYRVSSVCDISSAHLAATMSGTASPNVLGNFASASVSENGSNGYTLSESANSVGGLTSNLDTTFPAVHSITVTKDIGMTLQRNGMTDNVSAHISGLTQSFDVPEPGSVAMFIGMGISGGLLALRRRRK